MSVASCPLATLSLAYADYDLSASLLILSILWIVWLIFSYSPSLFFFFLNDPAPPEIYPLSLPDALPICQEGRPPAPRFMVPRGAGGIDLGGHHLDGLSGERGAGPPQGHLGHRGRRARRGGRIPQGGRSEEHTSELQSLAYLVCRLLLEKK